MSIQKNLLIGAGVLGVVLVTSKLVSGETPKNNDDVVMGGDDPSYLSKVNPYGINPETGNTFCEDYNNCPDDESDGGDDGEKTCPEGKVRQFNTSSDSWECVKKKKDKINKKAYKINKKAYIAANIVEASPIPGGSLIGKALKTPEGRKAIKKGMANSKVGKKYTAGKKKYNKGRNWLKDKFSSEAEETHPNINSSQSFMSEFF